MANSFFSSWELALGFVNVWDSNHKMNLWRVHFRTKKKEKEYFSFVGGRIRKEKNLVMGGIR